MSNGKVSTNSPTAPLEFFFDVSSPWTYLAVVGIRPIAERLGIGIDWRPILVGGVFNAINPGLYKAREAMFGDERRSRHYFKDLSDWAAFYGVRIGQPAVFPVNSVKAMRGCLVAQQHQLLEPYMMACFERYWGDLADISQPDILGAIADDIGLGRERLFAGVEDQQAKDRLRSNTQELIDRGGFGSPTMFVGKTDMYFGNDRLPLVERALERLR